MQSGLVAGPSVALYHRTWVPRLRRRRDDPRWVADEGGATVVIPVTGSGTALAETPAHWKYGMRAVAAGLAGLVAVVLIVTLIGKGDVVGIIGAVASPVVAIVSAYFRVSATASSAASAQQAVKEAGNAATAASPLVDPHRDDTRQQVQDLIASLTRRAA